MSIMGMTKEDLVAPLGAEVVNRSLSAEEIVYLAKTLGALWQYDYQASEQGKLGMHAVLKSGRHSDGFFISRILLQHPNIINLLANQLAIRFMQRRIRPDWVAGVPDGATELGQHVARLIGAANNAEMKKEEDRIELVSSIGPGQSMLLVEDFCTRGTGFKQAVLDIISKQPRVVILPYELVILNRGGLKEIDVEGVGSFQILAAVEHRVNDWLPEECPLCKKGSTPIKPKATDENWQAITTSQQA